MRSGIILADWDGDGRLEIIQAGHDGHLHRYRADGTEVRTGNWPIQVRVPDSIPITRPALNNHEGVDLRVGQGAQCAHLGLAKRPVDLGKQVLGGHQPESALHD